MKIKIVLIIMLFAISVNCKAFEEKSAASPTPTAIPTIIIKSNAAVVNFNDNKHFIKDMTLLQDGKLLFVGSTFSTDEKNENIYILFVSGEGQKLSEKIYGDDTNSVAKIVYQSKSGKIYIAGTSDNKLFIMRIEQSGSIVWHKKFAEIFSNDNAISLTESIDDGIIAISEKIYSSYANPYSVKLSSSGDTVWETVYESGSKIDRVYFPKGVVIDNDTYLVVSKVDYDSILLRVKEPDGRWTAGTAFDYEGRFVDLNIEVGFDTMRCNSVPVSLFKCKNMIVSPLECESLSRLDESGVKLITYADDVMNIKQIFSVPIYKFVSIIDGAADGYIGIANKYHYSMPSVSMIFLDSNFIPKKMYVFDYLSNTEPIKIFQVKTDAYIIYTKHGITKVSSNGKRIW